MLAAVYHPGDRERPASRQGLYPTGRCAYQHQGSKPTKHAPGAEPTGDVRPNIGATETAKAAAREGCKIDYCVTGGRVLRHGWPSSVFLAFKLAHSGRHNFDFFERPKAFSLSIFSNSYESNGLSRGCRVGGFPMDRRYPAHELVMMCDLFFPEERRHEFTPLPWDGVSFRHYSDPKIVCLEHFRPVRHLDPSHFDVPRIARGSVMGKRSDFERRPADFYPTPKAAVLPLIRSFRRPGSCLGAALRGQREGVWFCTSHGP